MYENKSRLLGALFAVLAGVLYGICPVLMKFALLIGITNDTLVLLRFLICVVLLLVYAKLTKTKRIAQPKKALKLFILGAGVYSIMTWLNVGGISRIPVSMASLLLCLYPVFVAFFSVLLKKDTMTIQKATALIVCVTGIYMLLGVTFENINPVGLLMSFGASLSYTAYVILGSDITKDVDPIMSSLYMMSGVAAAFAVLGMLSGNLDFNISREGWLIITSTALFGAAMPVVLFWKSISLIGATNASILGSVEPLTTAVVAVFVFREFMTFSQTIGALAIVLGVIIIQLPLKTKGGA